MLSQPEQGRAFQACVSAKDAMLWLGRTEEMEQGGGGKEENNVAR